MRQKKIGFTEAKRLVLTALATGAYLHESRNVDAKNKLLLGEISPEQVADIIRKSTGKQHQTSPHHADARITVHTVVCLTWYIKFYFVDPNTVFISVHEEGL
jgi:hypothetical protein